jgi:hypothetical protein
VLESKNWVRPPELVVMVAFPAVLVSRKSVSPKALLVMVALPAFDPFWKFTIANAPAPKPLTIMIASPALPTLLNCISVPRTLKVVGPPTPLPMPAPVKLKLWVRLKEYAGAPALNWRVPTEALAKNARLVIVDAPKEAVPVGTTDGPAGGTQLAAVFQLFDVGAEDQVASCACAVNVPNHTPANSTRITVVNRLAGLRRSIGAELAGAFPTTLWRSVAEFRLFMLILSKMRCLCPMKKEGLQKIGFKNNHCI